MGVCAPTMYAVCVFRQRTMKVKHVFETIIGRELHKQYPFFGRERVTVHFCQEEVILLVPADCVLRELHCKSISSS